MRLLDLFFIAFMPVLKVLLITALGLILALDRFNVMGESTRKELNRVVFFVFNPAMVAGNLAKTITYESIVLLWFMPVNILCTFIIGSALGWILVKITAPPKHIKGLILGCCAAGNMGNLPLIIVPAICVEKGSPFGPSDVCHTNGVAYASLSMAIGAIYLWTYAYNIMRIYTREAKKELDSVDNDDSISNLKAGGEAQNLIQGNYSEALLPSNECLISSEYEPLLPQTKSDTIVKILSIFKLCEFEFMVMVPTSDKIKECLRLIARKLNLKALFAPSTVGAIVGFVIGLVPQIRDSLIGASAPLHVVEDSASLLGNAAIPTVTLIVGGNLLRGLKGSGIRLSLIIGILAVRCLFLPLIGIVVVRGAIRCGLVNSDPLYQFILLLQFALPPAMNIGTITQLFQAGESECSVIMLWTYALASVSLTLWSTLFIWIVA